MAGMRNFWLNIPRSASAVQALELSWAAKRRLRMMVWYDEHGRNAALACRHFGISRDTFHRRTAVKSRAEARAFFFARMIQRLT